MIFAFSFNLSFFHCRSLMKFLIRTSKPQFAISTQVAARSGRVAPVALAQSPSRAPIVRLDGAARGTASAHSPRFRTLVLFGLATFRRPRKIAEAVNVAVGVINGARQHLPADPQFPANCRLSQPSAVVIAACRPWRARRLDDVPLPMFQQVEQ